MISILASSVVGRAKDYEIGICCFAAKNTALRSKSKDCLAWIQDYTKKNK